MPRMVIVDDEPEVLEELAEVFGEYGYEIDTAHGGEEALRKVKEKRPHLMLLDIRMPGMSGLEVLRRVRKLDPSLGIIMVTAVMEENLAKEAMTLGAFDYITKPIDLDYLRTSVVIKIINMLGSDPIA
ncbi:MAG: response regulator [Candidatus Tectomicrobia bacterium]|nr:response regulator [Candidatus Tectomicrobia bacterium]